jgi:hypothetical protein
MYTKKERKKESEIKINEGQTKGIETGKRTQAQPGGSNGAKISL